MLLPNVRDVNNQPPVYDSSEIFDTMKIYGTYQKRWFDFGNNTKS